MKYRNVDKNKYKLEVNIFITIKLILYNSENYTYFTITVIEEHI